MLSKHQSGQLLIANRESLMLPLLVCRYGSCADANGRAAATPTFRGLGEPAGANIEPSVATISPY